MLAMLLTKLKKFLSSERGAISLIEILIILIIMGLISGSALKGYELITKARLQKTATQINTYIVAFQSFVNNDGRLPGDIDSTVQDYDGLKEESKSLKFWSELQENGFIDSLKMDKLKGPGIFGCNVPASSIGGGFTVVISPYDWGGVWLVLGSKNDSRGDGALLTTAQAKMLNIMLDGTGKASGGSIRSVNIDGKTPCIKNGDEYDTSVKTVSCAIYVLLQNG
jgi:type II secretory pathway pseudopilin PulG